MVKPGVSEIPCPRQRISLVRPRLLMRKVPVQTPAEGPGTEVFSSIPQPEDLRFL